jgi:hypothetical protein
MQLPLDGLDEPGNIAWRSRVQRDRGRHSTNHVLSGECRKIDVEGDEGNHR